MPEFQITYDLIKDFENIGINPIFLRMFRMVKDQKTKRFTDYIRMPKNWLFNVCNAKDFKQRKFRARIVVDADGEKHILISNGLPKPEAQTAPKV